jgi:hypothetical protein
VLGILTVGVLGVGTYWHPAPNASTKPGVTVPAVAVDPEISSCMGRYQAYDFWKGRTKRPLAKVCESIVAMTAEQSAKYSDMATENGADCLVEKGFGAWVGSSNIPLSEFCASFGSLAALKQMKNDNPEFF